ncbi:MAG: glycoside hydrolase [Firmicutes bacterium]|nr:glycoside hydrolase [Bacillota bacterium]
MTLPSAPLLTASLDDLGRVSVTYRSTTLLTITPHDWIVEHVRRVTHRRWIAWDFFREHQVTRRVVTRVIALGEGRWYLVDDRGREIAALTVVQLSPTHLELSLLARESEVNRMGFHWWGPIHEVLWGFGEYTDGPAKAAGRWSTWTEEGPVGLGPFSPLFRWTGRVPLPRGHQATYAPVPRWLSSLNYGGWSPNYERIDWAIRGARRTVRAWTRKFVLHLVAGETLKEVIERQHAALGPMPDVPLWVFGPWIDAVRGEAEVRRVVRTLRQKDIPASAIWIEDWMGSWEDDRRFWMRPLSHEIHRGLYPHLEDLMDELHQQNFKVLGYLCPEIAVDTPLYREAEREGHLVRDGAGQPVDIAILGHHHGQLDLTRPETRAWVKERIMAPLARAGFDGWMADFGEYLPVTAVLHDKTTGWVTHNRYPELWQAVNREFWEEARPNKDYVFFVRSAHLRSPQLAPVLWGGDSDTDWDRADGLPTVVPQALSAGLSGFPLWSTDIAGYMTLGLTRPSTKELYLRWTELGALLPVMRTHHGTARPRNWRWDRDDETTRLFARYARLHVLLLPYWHHLLQIAHRTGLPLVRPVYLEYPDLRYARENREYLLGPDLLVAPVLKPRRRQWRVLLPPGRWLHWWSQEWYNGPQTVVVPAPLGRLPLFLREGAALPVAEGCPAANGIAPGFLSSLTTPADHDAAARYLTVVIAGALRSECQLRLIGGTLVGRPSSVTWARAVRRPPPAEIDHAPLLGRPGETAELKPYTRGPLGAALWEWHGAHPLTLTVRQVP